MGLHGTFGPSWDLHAVQAIYLNLVVAINKMIVTYQFRIVQPDPLYNAFYIETYQSDGRWDTDYGMVFYSVDSAKKEITRRIGPKPVPVYYDYP